MKANSHPPAPVDLNGSLAYDVLRQGAAHPLDPFFRPRAVALIGATETRGSVGRTLLQNLIATPFGGTVYPVNPKRDGVLGIRAYRSIADVPSPVDLAVIATPAPTVPAVVAACADQGVPAAIIISAGFHEVGPAGAALEKQILAEAARGRMRIIGPNCLGVMSPLTGMNATFAAGVALPGNVAFLSQSGALLTAILDWSLRARVGFSAFVSLGSMIDVGWGDLIDYLGDDPRTRAIVMYMESIGDARAFLSAAREVALTKPIIVIKAGRSAAASRAAASHTGALTGSDDVLDAAFRRCGVLRVNDIGDVFRLADVLDRQPRPAGPRLTIVTNAGGPAVLATDALVAGGGELAALTAETLGRLNAVLPAAWSHANPLDILGDADPARYATALEIAASDAGSDGLLAILTPQDMTDPTLTAEALAKHAHIEGKPVLASWMGGADVAAGVDILNRAGIPTFEFPDDAARTFGHMWRYAENLRGLYQTPSRVAGGQRRPAVAATTIAAALAENRTLLDEHESKALLESYGIPVTPTRVARTEAEAVAAAQELGFPVAVKLWSRTITHKSDVGGVRLGVTEAAGVGRAFRDIQAAAGARASAGDFLGVTVQPMVDRRDGYELILGSSVDAQFGPVLMFGLGGELVEVFRDRSLALPPLNTVLAARAIAETHIARALRGVRGRPPIDVDLLAHVLVRFGDLVIDNPRIQEIDVNPLLASPRGVMALDARVVLADAAVPDAALPRLAIRPYPTAYTWPGQLRDGTPIRIRPIRPEDEPALVVFHATLSEQSVRMRYAQSMTLDQRTTHQRLIRVCFTDYDRELPLVVERDAGAGAPMILALGRLSRRRVRAADDAEFSLLVGDPWQRQGIGRQLLARLVEVAAHEGIARVHAEILEANLRMQRLCASLGFHLSPPDGGVIHAQLTV
ncbi:MAG TPA: bifunctional acetate--CoA ligase family protein/GNAT family N-acetyltransferase [Polyangia bacterium]|nr:bifunctional acetate--CoA ligase family protein/GNAT family N-acetyltransferase [Polyangia bacterium]